MSDEPTTRFKSAYVGGQWPEATPEDMSRRVVQADRKEDGSLVLQIADGRWFRLPADGKEPVQIDPPED